MQCSCNLFPLRLITIYSNRCVDGARYDEDLFVRGRHIEPLPALRLGGVHHVRLAAPHAAFGAAHDRVLEVEAVRLDDAVADGDGAGVTRVQVAQALVEEAVARALHSARKRESTG